MVQGWINQIQFYLLLKNNKFTSIIKSTESLLQQKKYNLVHENVVEKGNRNGEKRHRL